MRKEPQQQPADFTIAEWCAKRRISRSGFYNLKKRGLTPKIIRNGARTIITVEADQEWRLRMEADA
jgi:hypothetical protein